MQSPRWSFLALLVWGCTSGPATSPVRPRLVATTDAEPGPSGADARTGFSVAFRMADGSLLPVALEAVSFVPSFRGGAALVDRHGRLYEVRPDGTRRLLASGASGSLAASADGDLLAYVLVRNAIGQVHIAGPGGDSVVARNLSSAGVLRFTRDGERLHFVAARPGGVVGVWTAPLSGAARCLTNCELRTGEAWRASFVEPPVDPSSFDSHAGEVVWLDARGLRHAARFEVSP